MATNDRVHVFSGQFGDREAATRYSEAQWEPEPSDDVSDEEYSAWEDRNPHWQLRDDLGRYLQSDFIETIFGDDRHQYLATLLVRPTEIHQICRTANSPSDTLVLVFSEALGGFPGEMRSTQALQYLGEFACELKSWDG
ncbi:hypothetical protein NA78x_000940 [Anatilimnocola sp. NA78]|uniref:hypothetical protein n=1 Tax=Anatilimnocola sp. NA78 TaxID=3415683 RepID=UPI003CE4DB44